MHSKSSHSDIFQLDENATFSDSGYEASLNHPNDDNVCDLTQSHDNQKNVHIPSKIDVIVGNRPVEKTKIPRKPVRKTIRRDNRGELSLYLPNMAVYNHRSIWKKHKNFCLEFHEMSMGIALHSEVWEKRESKKHKLKIEEMLEMEGISYISTARPDRRGGGCAITCDISQYHLMEIKLDNPDNLEVTFATLRPKDVNSPQFVIILATTEQEKVQDGGLYQHHLSSP
jgi:hypothetical protein